MNDSGTLTTLQLLRRYGILLVALPAIVVAVVVSHNVRDVIIDDYGRMVAAGLESFVNEAYRDGALESGTSSEAYATLDQDIQRRMDRGHILAARVMDPEGLVVYSTDPAEVGAVVDPHAGAADALAGEVAVTVTEDPEMSLADGVGRVVEVHSPVRAQGDVVGVTVMYRPYSQVARAVTAAMVAIVATVMGGGIVTYVLVLLLVGSAERQIRSGHAMVGKLDRRLSETLGDMQRHSLGTMQALIAAVDAKDSYTARHSLNVTEYACAIGRRMGLDGELATLERAGLVHDVGKIGVAEKVLLKPARLNPDEIDEIRGHSQTGAHIIEALPFLHDVTPVVLRHHERWDGGGYPGGVAGEEIPLLARILAVADTFDAMTSDRPYRPALPAEVARTEIERMSGKQFDPAVVQAFVETLEAGELRGTMVREPHQAVIAS